MKFSLEKVTNLQGVKNREGLVRIRARDAHLNWLKQMGRPRWLVGTSCMETYIVVAVHVVAVVRVVAVVHLVAVVAVVRVVAVVLLAVK